MMKCSDCEADDVISVVIPTCDRPISFLLSAIESVREQILRPAEILVVDNGLQPVDGSVLGDGVTLLRLRPRVGPSRARNFGAAMSQGRYLAFLDDDDFWDAGFLSEAMHALNRDNSRCVYGRIDRLQDGERHVFKVPTLQQLTIPVLLERNPGTGGINLLIEKELFWAVGGFHEDLLTSEDKALAIDVLDWGEKISVTETAVAVARAHGGPRLTTNMFGRLKFIWKYRHRTDRLHVARLMLRRSKQAIRAHLFSRYSRISK